MTTRDIGDLSTNPAGKGGDEWTRGTRASVLALWGLNGGLLRSVAGTNALTASLLVGTAFTVYSDGMRAVLVPAATNTGAVTLDLNSVGIKALVGADGGALDAGELVAGTANEIVFVADSDHWRLLGSAGTTNVTVTGGIHLQRSAPARLVTLQGPTTDLTSVASRSFQALQSASRVIVEGAVSCLIGAGVADDDGLVISLYVDSVSVDSFTDGIEPALRSLTAVYFEYSPGDTDAHTYEIRVQSTVAATYFASANFIVCTELSPNA